MKQIIFTILSLGLFVNVIAAQDAPCQPDETFRDSVGVFPLPFDAEASPEGGITEIACVGKPYEFVFTIVIGDTLNLSGAQFVIDSIIMDQDSALTGIPSGMDYSCNPPSCGFYKDSSGCVVISGITDESVAPGDYPLTITGLVYSGFIELPLTFPNPAIAPGSYSLTVEAADSENCITSSVSTFVQGIDNFQIAPNPAHTNGFLDISVASTGTYELSILDLLGRTVYQNALQLGVGDHRIPLDLSGLESGTYFYRLSDGVSFASKKLAIRE